MDQIPGNVKGPIGSIVDTIIIQLHYVQINLIFILEDSELRNSSTVIQELT